MCCLLRNPFEHVMVARLEERGEKSCTKTLERGLCSFSVIINQQTEFFCTSLTFIVLAFWEGLVNIYYWTQTPINSEYVWTHRQSLGRVLFFKKVKFTSIILESNSDTKRHYGVGMWSWQRRKEPHWVLSILLTF